jgi:glutaredoxin
MFRRLFAAAVLCSLAGMAQASAIEDLFRGLIDRLKSEKKFIATLPIGPMVNEITKPELLPRKDELNLGKDQIAIFVAPRCKTCDEAVARLKKRGFQVEVLDLAKSTTAKEAFELTGAKGVPTVITGKRMLSGYNDKLFDQLLRADIMQKVDEQRGTGA